MINLAISFSGGKTSAYMTRRLLLEYSNDLNIVVIFANTGEENLKTLEFINNCDLMFNFNTVWVEADVHGSHGEATTHRVVNYETASRNGKPFENVISKFGLPNTSYPHCTRELKQRPIHSYIKNHLGWEDYKTAIGIRDDELRRVAVEPGRFHLVYPIVHWWTDEDITKEFINDWWDKQLFNLDILEHQGNCKTCWKKSLKKHELIMKENPEYYDFNRRMESLHSETNSKYGPRKFFRGNKTTEELFDLSDQDVENDRHYGCPSETCEPFIGED